MALWALRGAVLGPGAWHVVRSEAALGRLCCSSRRRLRAAMPSWSLFQRLCGEEFFPSPLTSSSRIGPLTAWGCPSWLPWSRSCGRSGASAASSSGPTPALSTLRSDRAYNPGGRARAFRHVAKGITALDTETVRREIGSLGQHLRTLIR